MKESSFLRLVTIVSIAIPVAVAAIFYLPLGLTGGPAWLSNLPAFHAILNGTCFVLLLLALMFIKNKRIDLHKTCMLIATGLSSVFLLSYVFYHVLAPQSHYGGEGGIRTIYFTLLITHILLAAVILPFVLISLYRGLTGQVDKHRKIAKITLPMWLYVTLTGVIVYLMMSPYYPA